MERAAFENLLLVSFELCKIVIFDPRHFIFSFDFFTTAVAQFLITDKIRSGRLLEAKRPREITRAIDVILEVTLVQARDDPKN